MTYDDLKHIPMSEELDLRELRLCLGTVVGAVAWPGKEEGACIVVAMDRHSNRMLVVGEFESWDIRELIRQAGVLDFRFLPERWVGDVDDSAGVFVSELNAEPGREGRRFYPTSTWMGEMDGMYRYILAEIKQLCRPDHRQLELRDSLAVDYLSAVEQVEVSELKLGDYPGIEALAHAAIILLEKVRAEKAALAPKPKREQYNPLWSGLRRKRA